MTRTVYRGFALLLWLALPGVALQYWQVWDKLPPRMATHFNFANQPNGWMTPTESLRFILVMMAGMLTVFTVLAWIASRKSVNAASWALLGLFYVSMAALVAVNKAMLSFNVDGTPLNLGPWLVAVPVAVLVFVVVFLSFQRGQAFPRSEVLAEEVHSGKLWAAVLAAPVVGVLALATQVPSRSAQAGLGLVALALLGAAALAWTGFHYVFTRSGVEVRSLGFRLRSIPAEQIKEYGAQGWNVTGGYGIRGVGSTRAYVWGNKVVHIRTTNGEVYLGHSDPQRIVRDLDLVKGFVMRG
jgi:Protein of unknown function (DUF1648)